jgi:hypothetical protein
MTILEELVAMGFTADQAARIQPILLDAARAGLNADAALDALRHSFDIPHSEIARMADAIAGLARAARGER